MVAAGATILMAASEESSSNGAENSTAQCANQSSCSRFNEIHHSQEGARSPPKKDVKSCLTIKDKNRSHMLEKTSRIASKTESKDNSKSHMVHKTAPIRETKTSRLRAAAAVISPNAGSSLSRKLGVSEVCAPWCVQSSSSISQKNEIPISGNSSTMNPTRERDKSHKRKSYLNRSLNVEVLPTDRLNQSECSDRRSKRQSSKQGHISETISTTESGSQRQISVNLHKRHVEPKLTYQRCNTHNATNRHKTHTCVTSPANVKYSTVQQTSDGLSNSEVSRRVDALTALTKATMERVERLASHTNLAGNHAVRSENHLTNASSIINPASSTDGTTNTIHVSQISPRKCSILKRPNDDPQDSCPAQQHVPVSILKHKVLDNETGQTSSNSSHTVLPVTFSPSVVEPVHKRHGILKKRSSLDESEILRRRSCSPDVSFTDNSYSEFRPILKNQRRSSLDDIIKRDQSPDPQPTSILKRKTSREDDREDRQLGSPEPQGILKRKSANSVRLNSTAHHVTIATDTLSVSAREMLDNSEVRPILKKKHSREESSGNDPPLHEPRPILKKKSSTESDEHEDRPKKTILKSTRKNSQDECNHEAELTSPKKLSMLRNRVLQNRTTAVLDDCVRPILKQSGLRDESRVRLNFYDTVQDDGDVCTESADFFLRKRAQSVGHIQPSNSYNELTGVLTKRRSLELTSTNDAVQEKLQPRAITNTNHTKPDFPQSSESTSISTVAHDIFNSVLEKDKCTHNTLDKDKQSASILEGESVLNAGTSSINSIIDKENSSCVKEPDIMESPIDRLQRAKDEEEELNICDTEESSVIRRSNSVSKMTMHFKALQEKANTAEKDNLSQRGRRKASHGIQRYRERKVQGVNDRFNTQPVTLQEVQEAVLQNQRNAISNNKPDCSSTSGDPSAADDEFDPLNLSFAERVWLFNQKIAVEFSAPSSAPQERHTRRRPATRYKTQPVTLEEVEVASQITPLSAIHRFSSDGGVTSQDGQPDEQSNHLLSSGQHELPKSILKSTGSHTYNSLRTESPELQGLKLIKSVLKKESEDSEQQISENCDTLPRSILKNNTRLEESSMCGDDNEARDGNSYIKFKSPSIDAKIVKQRENSIDYVDVQRELHSAYDIENNHVEGIPNETKQRQTVPFQKNLISQDESIIRSKCPLDDVDNVYVESNAFFRKQTERNKTLTSDEENSSGGHEVHNIMKNETTTVQRQTTSTKQTRYASLSKSASHHALGNETVSFSGAAQRQGPVALPGLCRSATQAMPMVDDNEGTGLSIADRLAALQRSGNTNWKRRVVTETVNLSDSSCSQAFNKEDLSIKQGVLADCLGKLESAAEGWKKRVMVSDVTKFTVAGKMKVEKQENLETAPSSPLVEVTRQNASRKKKVPQPERFRAKRGDASKSSPIIIRRSFSEPTSEDSGEECKSGHSLSPTVSVSKADDETFTSFFTGISLEKCETECLNLDERDFDVITSQTELLVQKRNIRAQRRRVASGNPLKALAARTDLKSEYTEVRTGIAEKVMRSLNIEKLAKNSPLAVEALAGLASTEDFSNITLRNTAETSVLTNKLQPYKDLMLILIKGRRHVQVRLVEPVVDSLNSGDNYVLVTKSEVYNYIGKYSNVIEKARAAEIALSIQQNKDLGCQASQVITINEDKLTCTKSQLQKFWNYLGANQEEVNVIEGGHPDEDELYETAMIDTNMIYEVKDLELVPLEKHWGAIPKIEMLDPSKVLVFDFGSEMYIWSGKGASSEQKRIATQLANEMWNEGYDYTECAVCPINAASLIGRRSTSETDLKRSKIRPKWCLLAKLTQHVETVLFREKFLDWPNVSGIIRVRGTKDKEYTDGTITVELCNVESLLEPNRTPVDLVLEGSHLGRGTGWYDDELMKQYVVTTTSVAVWHIDEFCHTILDELSIGQFYTGDSYIIRWMYSITITGRELSGLPSKHSAKGRDRSVYFIWQGQNASLNEQGAAALLTINLDNDQGPQVRVVQGHEPAAFLNLFHGAMMVHGGKKIDQIRDKPWRLYIARGTEESETFLTEVPCSTRQLRSRASLVLINGAGCKIYVWHGNNVLPHIKKNAMQAVGKLKENRPREVGLSTKEDIDVQEIEEGNEPKEFFDALGGANKKLYVSLAKEQIQKHSPRLFHLSSISKEFKPTELLCPHRADLPTPFPFLQEELYQVNQPALFLLDNKIELWIWQGWWPDTEAEDQSGSKAVRWQAERRAAMTMAVQYWKEAHPESTKLPIYLVWAGLEPLQFINLFPTWINCDDIAELNIEDGRNAGEVLTVENELARLTQSTYPPAQLLQRPLPEGVDPTRLELYLSQQHFQELLGMSMDEFQELPVWKQVNLKKEIGLF